MAAAEAISADDPRPFAGVPIAVKDTAPVAGMPYTMGSDVFGDFVPGHDAFLVRRLRDAGFVIVGKTSMPEFGILPVSEPRRFGPVRNPWDTDRTPGGSSGGAAAAVASGMLPLAHGSDGGGSIRIPASCCGLVGLKPTRGRISRGPDQGDDFLVQDGVLTRTVAETAATARHPGRLRGRRRDLGATPFRAIRCSGEEGARAGSASATPQRRRSRPTSTHSASKPFATPRSCSASSATTSRRSRRRGARRTTCSSVFTMVFGTPIAMGMFFGGLVTGREPTEELVEPLSWTIWNGIRERTALDYLLARTQLTGISRGIIALWETYDVVLTPGLAERPVRIGEIDACSDDPVGGLPPLRPLHPLHRHLQRDRPARHLGAALPRRRRAADLDPARRPPRRRGHAALARRAARGGAALGRPPARARNRLGTGARPRRVWNAAPMRNARLGGCAAALIAAALAAATGVSYAEPSGHTTEEQTLGPARRSRPDSKFEQARRGPAAGPGRADAAERIGARGPRRSPPVALLLRAADRLPARRRGVARTGGVRRQGRRTARFARRRLSTRGPSTTASGS